MCVVCIGVAAIVAGAAVVTKVVLPKKAELITLYGEDLED
jgi:hypothetical protein